MLSLILLAGYAAVAALLTRSILGGLLAGFGISLLEPMSFAMLILVGRLLTRPEIINLYQFTPTYSSDNIRSWLTSGVAFTRVNEYFTAEPGLAVSSLVLSAWIVGLVGLAAYVFERQDITS